MYAALYARTPTGLRPYRHAVLLAYPYACGPIGLSRAAVYAYIPIRIPNAPLLHPNRASIASLLRPYWHAAL